MYIGAFVVLFNLVIAVNTQIITKNSKSCSGITLGKDLGSLATHLLKKPASGLNLKICLSNLTCCSQQMENGLYIRSSRSLKDAIRLRGNDTVHILASQSSTFDDYFKTLFKEAQAQWHSMLFMTYKKTYQENRHVFQTFFSSLDNYYGNDNVNISKTAETFFKGLLRKVIVLLKPSLNGTQGFLDCISKKINVIYEPFDRRRLQLTSQLKSSLQVSRSFVKGLQIATSVAASLINQLPTTNCLESFTKIQHCSICSGVPNAMVCKRSCQNVLESCFSSAVAVDRQWDGYLDLLYRLSIAMEGPYNIQAVYGTLSYDISSTIMELQAHLDKILKRAREVCPFGKTKRSVDSTGSDLYLEEDRRSKRASSSLPAHFGSRMSRPSRKAIVKLDSLTKDFRKQISGMKSVWSTLPKKICNEGLFRSFLTANDTENCWNGIGLQSNTTNVSVLKLFNNTARGDIQALLSLLAMEMKKMKIALEGGFVPQRGDKINFLPQRDDNDDDNSSGSGSGSGLGEVIDGSGRLDTTVAVTPSVQTTVPEDDEDRFGSGSGSGNLSNTIAELSTEAAKTINSVEDPTDSDHSFSNDIAALWETTVSVKFAKSSGRKTSFGASVSVAHLGLFLSALPLYVF